MKKLIYSVFAVIGAMTMASCAVDKTDGTFGVNGNNTVTLNASVDHTRTSFNSDTHTLGWADGDTYDVVAVNAAGEFLAHFGNLPFSNATIELPEGTDQLYAYYPPVYDIFEEEYVEINSLEDVYFSIWGAMPDSTDPEYSYPLEQSIPMAAKAKVSGSDVAITFKTLVSIIELNVYGDASMANDVINSYTLSAQDDTVYLSGSKFTVDWTQDELALTADEYSCGNCVMNYTDPAEEPTVGTSKANGTKLHTIVPRGVYSDLSFTIAVTNSEDDYNEYTFDYASLDMTVFGRTLNINLSTGAGEDYLTGFFYTEAEEISGFDPENVEFKVLTEADAEAEDLAEDFATYPNAQFYKITYKKNPVEIAAYPSVYGMFKGELPEDSWEDDGNVEYYVSFTVNPWTLNDILEMDSIVNNKEYEYVTFPFDWSVPTADNHVAKIQIMQSWQPVAVIVVDFAYAENVQQGGGEAGNMTFTLTPSEKTTESFKLTIEPSGDSYYGYYKYHSNTPNDLEGAKSMFGYQKGTTSDAYQGTQTFTFGYGQWGYVYEAVIVYNCDESGKITVDFDDCTVFEYDYTTAGGGNTGSAGNENFTLTPSEQTTESFKLTVEPSGDGYYGYHNYHSYSADDLDGAKDYFNKYVAGGQKDAYKGTQTFTFGYGQWGYVYEAVLVFECDESGNVLASSSDECAIFEYDYTTAGGTAGDVDLSSLTIDFNVEIVGTVVSVTCTPSDPEIPYAVNTLRSSKASNPSDIEESIRFSIIYTGEIDGADCWSSTYKGTQTVNFSASNYFFNEGETIYAYAVPVVNGKYKNKIFYSEFVYNKAAVEVNVDFSFAFNGEGSNLTCTVTPDPSDAKWTGYVFPKEAVDEAGSAEALLNNNMWIDNCPGNKAYMPYTGAYTLSLYDDYSPENGKEYVALVMPVGDDGMNGDIIESEPFTFGTTTGGGTEQQTPAAFTFAFDGKTCTVTPADTTTEYVFGFVWEYNLGTYNSIEEYLAGNNYWKYADGKAYNKTYIGLVEYIDIATGEGSITLANDDEDYPEFYMVAIASDGNGNYKGAPYYKVYNYKDGKVTEK